MDWALVRGQQKYVLCTEYRCGLKFPHTLTNVYTLYYCNVPVDASIYSLMSGTQAEFVNALSEFDPSSRSEDQNLLRVLRARNVVRTPRQGRGNRQTMMLPHEYVAFILGKQAHHTADAPEVVRKLWALKPMGAHNPELRHPILGDLCLGEALKLIIGGYPDGPAYSKDGPILQRPNDLHFNVRPYRATLVWLCGDGNPERVVSYSDPHETEKQSTLFSRKGTFVNGIVLDIAGKALASAYANTTGAIPARTAPVASHSTDEHKMHTTERNNQGVNDPDVTPLVCRHATAHEKESIKWTEQMNV